MHSSFTMTRRVAFRDTDAAGIMHFSVFFTWMEDTEHAMLRSIGLSVASQDADGEIGWPRVATECEYQGPLKFEDEVTILGQLEKLGTKSATYSFQFLHEEREVARGSMTSVCCRIAPNEKPTSIPIPDAIAKKLQSLLSSKG